MSKRNRIIMLADCQSFYASVEKMAHPEYRSRPLVVAGDPERRSGIVLAACPLAKKAGVTTGESLRESLAKCPGLIAILPRMQRYIDVSLLITGILESYTEKVEPFSIDEQFIDVTNSLRYFRCDAEALARHIQMRVWHETGIYTRVGIAGTKVLAKMGCDVFAKKNDTGIYELTRERLPELWKHDTNKMFGVGTRTMLHLQRIGIRTIGDLAATPLPKLRELLWSLHGKKCDVLAEVLWRTANGLDDSPVTPDSFGEQKGIGRQTTLPVDFYKPRDIEVVLLELSSLICQRCRQKGYMGSVVHVGAQGADFDHPTGFSRQMKVPDTTQLTREVFAAAKQVFYKHWQGYPVRKLWVSLGDLQTEGHLQLTLFEDRARQLAMEKAMDTVHERHGPTSLVFASSATKAGQSKHLAAKIGGHYK
jgi:DNA polymerase-4